MFYVDLMLALEDEAEARYTYSDDYCYDLTDEQLLHGLSMTPLVRSRLCGTVWTRTD